MYRPGMGVDPWYENFKFFLTYWLLSSNNRDRMGDGDQLPPPPPPPPPNGPQGPPFMSPHHKPATHGGPGQPQNPGSKSPNPNVPSSGGNNTNTPNNNTPHPQINWDAMDKNPQLPQNNQRHTQNLSLLDGYGNIGLKPHLGPNSGPGGGGHGGNHGNQHHSNHQPNNVIPTEHMITDKDRRHVCPHCYKGFRSRQQLNQHNLVHSGIRKYHCLYCERAFKQLSHLQQHHRIHTGEKPYRCPMEGCDKAFAQMSNLQHHMRQHDKATFGQKHCMCPFCDRGYASEKSLKSHLSKMHPDSKMLGLGNGRSNLSLLDGQGHPMLGGPQPSVTISHHHSLTSMPHTMKSPLTPPLGGPLELTVNSVSHQRNSMGGDGRKYSLDSGKLPLGPDMPHDQKYFQRSLSDRLPDRDSGKIDAMLDQRFGLQNHIRDVNRFPGRPFEPFSPSRFHDNIGRAFDFKELESKLFDPSGEKLQRMAENFNEFRSRFQDQVFHMNGREGARGGGMPFDNRNMLHDMNDRNMFLNRNDINMNGRDRYQNSRNFSRSMNVNDLDSFASNRNDDLRVQSRNDMNLNSPAGNDYNRQNDRTNDDLGMQMSRQDMRRNSMRMDQNMNVRMSSENTDVMMGRNTLSMAQETDMRINQRNGMMVGGDNDMGPGMNPRTSMDMNMGGGRMMMAQDGRNGLMSNSMVANENGCVTPHRNELDMNDRSSVGGESDHDRRVRHENKRDMDMLDGNDIRVSRNNDMATNGRSDMRMQPQGNDMAMDENISIRDVNSNVNDLRIHSRNDVQIALCNDMDINSPDSTYSDKQDLRMQQQQHQQPPPPNAMMMNRANEPSQGVHEEISLHRSNSLQQLNTPNVAQKQNGHDTIMHDNGMEFVDGNENKTSPSSNLSDPNLIRQRKRKPANPQHVFMPTIDHFTSFASDEVDDCGNLMLEVEHGNGFERKISQVPMRN